MPDGVTSSSTSGAGSRIRRPIIGIMGAGEPSARSLDGAHELGRLLAQCGWIVLTGGRPEGVMGAAAAGAKQIAGSVTIGILPRAGGGAGPDVDIAIFTGMGEARNAINVLSSDVIIAAGIEGPGTVSEVALALKAGKPVILLNPTSAASELFQAIRGGALLLEAKTPVEAVRLVEEELGVPRWEWLR
jgi:uncharacterized protein (TIGR00725 family)